MAVVLIDETTLTGIANSIRTKLNTQATYKPGDMAAAISSISGGGSATLGTKNITSNATYNASSDNLDGYSSVTVNVPTGAAKSSSDLTANNLTVTAPAGLYSSDASKTLTDANLTAGNIKKDVTIFGVTGSYEGGGGGGSAVTGTITPSENSRSLTIPAIIGKSNVLIFPTTDNPASVSTRTHWGALFLNGRCILVGSSNSGGSSYTMVASWTPASSETTAKDVLDTTAGTITINTGAGSNYGGYFVSSITYQYVAW